MKITDEKKLYTVPNRLQLKTYSHLSKQKKIPNEYELVTSKMLYYVEKGGFEVTTPISDWYEQYQKNSPIRATTLDQFNDPQQTTYANYVQNQKDKEIFWDATIKHMDETSYDTQLDRQWIHVLSQVLPPLRYPWHGFQMVSSYLGSMAPEGKLVVVFGFQAMNEMRRIQRIAYRMRQLQIVSPTFGISSLADWQHAPIWQPLRRAIEHLLVTYDWWESFVALNLCFKPILDDLLLIQFSNLAKTQGDACLGTLFHSFWEDALWQQLWSKELVTLILKEDSQNKSIIEEWLTVWINELTPALDALKPLFFEKSDKAYDKVFITYKEKLNELQLQVKMPW